MKLRTIALPLLAAGIAGCATTIDDAAAQRKLVEIMKRDFHERGIAKIERLDQDALQAACTKYNNSPPHEGPNGLDKLEAGQMAAIKWPVDGKFLGDWKAGEKLAQDGRGMTWSDKAGSPAGGNCYNCHQLSPKELSYGTIGPSLYHYGKTRGNSAEVQKYHVRKDLQFESLQPVHQHAALRSSRHPERGADQGSGCLVAGSGVAGQ